MTAEARLDDPPRPIQRATRRSGHLWPVWALAAGAAVCAAASPAQPTGYAVIDAIWCGAFGALVTLAASRSRRWPWLWFAGIVTAAAIGSWWAVAGAGALGVALVGTIRSHRDRVLGAAVGALTVQAALRLPDLGFHGLPTILVAVALAPVLWSAYDRSPRRARRAARRGAAIALGVMAVAALGAGLGALVAEAQLRDAAADARAGVDLLRDADQARGAVDLEEAASGFATARDGLRAPWTWPGRLVPVVSQHIQALDRTAAAGEDLAATAARAATDAPYQQIKASQGRIDLPTLAAMGSPVSDAADALRRAGQEAAAVRSSWLVPPVADALTTFSDTVGDALPEVELAEQALRVAPALLGADGPREYLVLFTTPAESRFLGGFVGAYGLLTVDGGAIDFTASGGLDNLSTMLASGPRTLDDQPEFLTRYGRYNPTRYFQNVTASPDLPTDAAVARSLYEQTTGTRVDGVIVIDPEAIAALLRLTGPVTVDGLAEPLTADNAAAYLLHDQYVVFGNTAQRKDRLEAASRAVFQALTTKDLARPKALGAALGPATEEHRLLFHSFDPDEQALFERLGMSGRLAIDPGADYLSVRTANANPSKIDYFLQRTVDYQASYDPTTGRVTSKATIELRNDAPRTGLPDYVIGNDRDEPPGTNTTYLSVFSPLSLSHATLGGTPTGIEAQRELGANVYSTLVTVPPGGVVTLELTLEGTVHTGPDYRLSVLGQPLVRDDDVAVTVRSATSAWHVAQAPGMRVDGGTATGITTGPADRRFQVTFGH